MMYACYIAPLRAHFVGGFEALRLLQYGYLEAGRRWPVAAIFMVQQQHIIAVYSTWHLMDRWRLARNRG
jgi:hypothetical protein